MCYDISILKETKEGENMKIDSYLDLEINLKRELGDERLKNIVSEISEIVYENNLDVTPTILKDLFNYTQQSIQLSKI